MKTIFYDAREFREIPGYYGHYASMDGDVLSTVVGKGVSTRLLAKTKHNKGYLCCRMRGKNMLVHRAVALAWLANPESLPQVNHIDGNKQNNHVANLEWCTGSANVRHAQRTGLHPFPGVAVIGTNLKTGERFYFESQRAAGRSMGFDIASICHCVNGRQGHHRGYAWERA